MSSLAGTGDLIVGVCYRSVDPEIQAVEVFCRQIEAAFLLEALVITGDFDHLHIFWKDSTAENKQSKRFLVCVDVKFCTQGIEEPRRRGAMLCLVLTKEVLVVNLKVNVCFGCSDHEMVEYKSQQGGVRQAQHLSLQ